MGKHILLSIFLDSFTWIKEILSNLSGFVTVLIAVGVRQGQLHVKMIARTEKHIVGFHLK
jgi:hypothetical protein